MRILIVGGGVAGLAFAGFVKKYNLGEVVLIEKAPAFGTISFVFGIWGNGRKILKELGIDHIVVDKKGYSFDWNVLEDENGKLLKSFPFYLFKKFGPTSIVSRSDLQKGLIEAVSGTEVRFSTTILNLEQNDKKVAVEFSDGKREEFDLVVGADGIRSSVREKVFGNNFLHHYGWGIWVYWLPEGFAHPIYIPAYLGNGRMYSVFPLYERSVVWFVAKTPLQSGKDPKSKIELLKKYFSGFHSSVEKILEAIPGPEKVFYDDLSYVEMSMWYEGRVVLCGDAQHAASPISGMGSSMALEDAYVLADELRKTSDIDKALFYYEKRRSRRVRKYHYLTRKLDNILLAQGFFAKLRNFFLPLTPTAFFFNSVRSLLQEEI